MEGIAVTKLRVESFTLSLDGYGAGVEQTLENPMGVGGALLHGWAFTTRTFRTMFGMEGGDDGVNEDFAQRGFRNIGAWILGRNMFGPVRGAWPDKNWRGWWGEDPPYHVPVYVLTHYARPSLVMQGDTVFHFVTGGIHEALRLAKAAAGDKDVRLGGGVKTIRAYLQAGLVDEMHLAISPVLLGKGESLLGGLDLPALGYRIAETAAGAAASHVIISRTA
jgi:dihydrofolate reductase